MEKRAMVCMMTVECHPRGLRFPFFQVKVPHEKGPCFLEAVRELKAWSNSSAEVQRHARPKNEKNDDGWELVGPVPEFGGYENVHDSGHQGGADAGHEEADSPFPFSDQPVHGTRHGTPIATDGELFAENEAPGRDHHDEHVEPDGHASEGHEEDLAEERKARRNRIKALQQRNGKARNAKRDAKQESHNKQR